MTFEAFMYLSLPIPPGTRRYTLQVGMAVGGCGSRWVGSGWVGVTKRYLLEQPLSYQEEIHVQNNVFQVGKDF